MKQEDIQALLLPPDILQGKKALCVQPHPDDNEIGMGGTIAVLSSSGCRVDYLTMTDGGLGAVSPELIGEELVKVRTREVRDAGKILGVTEYDSLGFPDGTLNDVPRLAGMVAEVIRKGQYDMVFCPDPWMAYEAHWDHVVTGWAVAQAFISASLIQYPKGSMTSPANPFAIGFYFTNKPNTIIDITEAFDRKFEAIAAHKSQISNELLALYRAYFTMRGEKLAQDRGFHLGEGLRVMSPLHLHCFAEAEMI